MKKTNLEPKKKKNRWKTTRRFNPFNIVDLLKRSEPTTIKLFISREQIRKRAKSISQNLHNRDVIIWNLAEKEVALKYVFGKNRIPSVIERGYNEFNLEPNLVIHWPKLDEIRSRAQEISKAHPTIEQLHWWLAEKICLLDSIENQ